MKKLAILAAVVVLVGLPGLAMASTVGPTTTTSPISLTLTDWTGSLAFPKFNPALGTLTGVTLSVTGGLSTVLTVTNTGDASSSGYARTELALTVTDGGGYIDSSVVDMLSPKFNFSGLAGGGGTVTSGTLTQSDTNINTYTNPLMFAEFTGLGSVLLNAGTYTSTIISYNGGNTAATQVTNGSATGTITYEYTAAPVPAPPTLLLLGSGLVGLLAFRRRKSSKS